MAIVDLLIISLLFFTGVSSSGEISSPGVRLYWKKHRMVLDNGIVQVTLSSPAGEISAIAYNGIDVLEFHNREGNRGYWDIVWNKPGTRGGYDKLMGTNYSVIMENEDQVEVSFTRTWHASLNDNSIAPLNVDKRYILRRGSSKIYIYSILERLQGWPDADIDQIRLVFKLKTDKFHTMAISDDMQRRMPSAKDCSRAKRLAYPEAVSLSTHANNPHIRGEVDDKYQYSSENRENRVHGWIAEESRVGFWVITPSDEFQAGGPLKQDLTSHVGPTSLSMFTSTHYAGKDMDTKYRNGEPWRKVFGPVCVYLNSFSTQDPPLLLWQDAKQLMLKEVESWPYNFPQSKDFPYSDQRSTISGQLLVRDRYINERLMWAGFAYVGLAAPGEVGSWQTQTKGYQFWTRANKEGYFLIENVRPGNYNLYAWVPGFIGDWKHNVEILVQPGEEIELGVVVYRPPRNGPTLWEIGIPDRSAAEFFVPNPLPTLENKLFINHPTQKFRQYGLWDRYTDLYPKNDLIFTVGISNYAQDWFFAQVPRNLGNGTYEATTWKIKFELENVDKNGDYTLQVALASASSAELQAKIVDAGVRRHQLNLTIKEKIAKKTNSPSKFLQFFKFQFNNPNKRRPHFTTRLIGRDNAIARHGIHGLYWFYSINVPHYLLIKGNNTIYLTQSRSSSPFRGIMYDYIRFEAPSNTPRYVPN